MRASHLQKSKQPFLKLGYKKQRCVPPSENNPQDNSSRVMVISGESIQVSANGKAASVTKQCCNDSHKNVFPDKHQPVTEVVFVVSSDQRHGELVSPICIKHVELLRGWTGHFIGTGT